MCCLRFVMKDVGCEIFGVMTTSDLRPAANDLTASYATVQREGGRLQYAKRRDTKDTRLVPSTLEPSV
jgi:hypothetical protein